MAMNPPKLRDWKPGNHQVGLFLRTPRGAVVELVNDKTDLDTVNLARCILFGPEALSDAFKEQLAMEIARLSPVLPDKLDEEEVTS